MDAVQVTFLAALIAAAVSVTVTFGGGWRQRVHERSLAKVERQYQRQADAYVEALGLINHSMAWVDRTLPMIGPKPDPPGPPPDEVLNRANALVALFGSDATRAAMERLGSAQRDFEIHVMAHPSAQRAENPLAEEWGSWSKLQATREQCHTLQREVEAAMRVDLDKA